jgi:hypothetical protein
MIGLSFYEVRAALRCRFRRPQANGASQRASLSPFRPISTSRADGGLLLDRLKLLKCSETLLDCSCLLHYGLVNLRNIRPRRAPGQHRPERRRLPSPLAIEEAAGAPAPKDPIPQGCENGRMIIFDSGSGPKNRPFLDVRRYNQIFGYQEAAWRAIPMPRGRTRVIPKISSTFAGAATLNTPSGFFEDGDEVAA